ncbi:alpha/beta hydrolase [Microbacterium aoyamense]|uniref:Alpha/beta hydrolase n=1 Tax=Microbacterium aoyamense TaxID=344166 RepID=A0ABN2PBU2_9MICO|nr:alpha/beta hydrolase [Microbacterium aoyamense]
MSHSETDSTIPGPHGDIPLRVYRPDGKPRAGLVWLHGGAFSHNDINVPEAHWVAGLLADAGIVTVAIDYRLANDGIHFPVLTDECLAGWDWAVSEGFGVREGDWHVGGGSAGANLAASVALQLRDGRQALPKSLVLIYGVQHPELPEPSAELRGQLDLLSPEAIYSPEVVREMNLNYVGPAEMLSHPYTFPANADLHDLPPTLIVNSERDQLRASGEAFAAQLALAGVDIALIRERDVEHGHLNFPEVPGARRTVERIVRWINGVGAVWI